MSHAQALAPVAWQFAKILAAISRVFGPLVILVERASVKSAVYNMVRKWFS